MKKTIALLLLVLPLLCIAQTNYESGYFIENGIKTECLIKNMGWKYNPVSISYKLGEKDETKTKTIKDISEFMVGTNYKYKKFTVNIDRSASSTEFLLADRAPEWSQETLFLKLLVDGEPSLYQYEESNLVRYFYSSDGISAEQLVYKKFMRQGNIAENNMYRQQLYNLMKDQGYTPEKFEKTAYKEDDLVTLFSDYSNTKSGKAINLSEKRNKGSLNIKITPGITFTTFSLNNSKSGIGYDFNNKTGFRIGAEAEYVLPFNNNKWSIFADPNYQSYTNEATIPDEQLNFEIDYKFIQIPVGLRYGMYLNKDSKIFIDAAYNINVTMGGSKIFYQQYNVNNSYNFEIRNNSTFSVGAGFAYDRYSIAGRYINLNLLNDSPAWDSNFSTISVIFGYRLF